MLPLLIQSQEKEAMQKMREKAKELQRQRFEAQKRGTRTTGSSSFSMSSSSMNSGPTAIPDMSHAPMEPSRPSYA